MTALAQALVESSLPLPLRRGKVRDVYDLGDRLLIVATDRISAFDWVLPNGIPDKGRVLNCISEFWFEQISVENHLISSEVPSLTCISPDQRQSLRGRSMVVRKAQVVPFECVVRGYLEGSGWKEYQRCGSVCGIPLPKGLRQCDRLPEPIFTPATKAESGHDENVSFQFLADKIGLSASEQLRELSLSVYEQGSRMAEKCGILIADTKFEWGSFEDRLILIDEVLTPDSSRFWPADSFQPGKNQKSFDKQYVREWLTASSWDRESPPPPLPSEVIERTRAKYIEAYEKLTSRSFEWK